ncbi:MAG: glycosyltransferase [Spirochaetes bacterium]|nr:glycosyltransferase [Spirochaetota bacterium]
MDKKKTAVVVIPTYNEAENIKKMIDCLFSDIFNKIDNYKMMLLIVDGNSNDKTADIVKDKMKKFENLHLIVEEKKEGIGAAYVKGFNHAVKSLKADVLIEFDGDFQHPPELIIKLLDEIDKGYDYVIGSRNAKGGAYPSHWGFKRHFFSRFGGFVARFILFFPFSPFFKITDPTTGLKATRVENFFDKLKLDKLKYKGFAYKLELMHKMVELDAKVKQIPFKFGLRSYGDSKIDAQTPKEILKAVFRLRFNDKKSWRFVKFGTIGFLGYLVNSFFLEFLSGTLAMEKIASLFVILKDVFFLKVFTNRSAWAAGFATEISIIHNFTLNNIWTFRSKEHKASSKIFSRFLKFNFTAIGAIIIQFLAVGFGTLIFGNTLLIRQASLIFAIVFINIPYNWIMYNRVIWKKKK